jgi:hypothetical protein
LQQSRRSTSKRRALAAAVGVWFLIAGVLGMRHEANVAHVVDPNTGELRHASGMVGAHTATHSDYHAARGDHADTDVCALSAALHQAVDGATAAIVAFAAPSVTPVSQHLDALLIRALDVYRFAPKTSPPLHA